MPGNIQRRKSIHDRGTPQREELDQDGGIILENENSIDKSEPDGEYEFATSKFQKKTYEETNVSIKVSRSPQQNKQKLPSNNKLASETVSLWILVSVCLILFGITYFQHQEGKTCSFENLKNEYPQESDSMWKQLKYGMELILNKRIEKPAVYLLAHQGKRTSFNLIDDIAQHSSKCFGKKLMSMRIDDFLTHSDDYGYTIEKYKSKIKEGNVFLIANLNKISPRAARAFHAICDTHSPIQKNVVIFLSLTVEQNKIGNAHSVAEETLIELWGSELDENELDPLVTRVTDQVIVLKS